MALTKKQVKDISRYHRQRFLKKVVPHKLVLKDGVAVIACGDCDQVDDKYRHIARIVKGRIGRSRIHLLLLNGGGLLISGKWSEVRKRFGRQVADDIIDDGRALMRGLQYAVRRKGISDVFIYVHAPCGIANDLRMSITEILDRLVWAKDAIKSRVGGVLRVSCFFHVDWGSGKKKNTYFLSAEEWRQKRQRAWRNKRRNNHRRRA